MKKIIKCSRCKKLIDPKEKYIKLQTYDKGKLKEDLTYHWKCYEDFLEEGFMNKASYAINILSGSLDSILGELETDKKKAVEIGSAGQIKKKKKIAPLTPLG